MLRTINIKYENLFISVSNFVTGGVRLHAINKRAVTDFMDSFLKQLDACGFFRHVKSLSLRKLNLDNKKFLNNVVTFEIEWFPNINLIIELLSI